MTVTEQFVEKYNLRQKKYIDLSFVGDAYDYSTFELAISDVNESITTNALTSGNGAVRVFKGEEITVIRLLQDVKLTAQTPIKNNVIVDFNGFTITEAEGYNNSFFLISRWVESNPIGVVFYARNGGAIQTNNVTRSLALVCEYSAVIGLTIHSNYSDFSTTQIVSIIRIGNSSVESSCESKNIIEDCYLSLSMTGEAYNGGIASIYDLNCKNVETIISNTKLIVNNENYYKICDGVRVDSEDVSKTLKMINCAVEVDTTQEQATMLPRGIAFYGEKITMIDCSVKATSTTTSCHGISQNGTARIQNSDIIAISPNLDVNSAIGIYTSGTAVTYLKDTNVFGVTSGIQNSGTLYIDGGYLRSPGHGGLYNADSADGVGGKAYACNATFVDAMGKYQEFGATYNGANGAVYNGYGSYGWFDNCKFKGAVFVCKYASDDKDNDKGATVYISNSNSENGYRCDSGTTITFGTGMTGNMDTSAPTATPEGGTIIYTDDDYGELIKAKVPGDFFVTVADYLNDLNKVRIDLANLVGANELSTINTLSDEIYSTKADIKTTIEAKGVTIDEAATINTYASKVDEVYDAGYEKGKSEGGGISPTNYASTIQFSNDDWAESDNVVIDMPNLNYIQRTLFYNVGFNKIKTLTVKSETPITYCNGAFQGTSDTDTLERLILYVDFSQCTYFSNVFMKRKNLISIEGNPINFSSATTISSPFNYCSNLKSFRVVPNTIKANFDLGRNEELDEATRQSVIDGLADLTGSAAQTITWHADVKAKLTDEQKATITGKNWTIA